MSEVFSSIGTMVSVRRRIGTYEIGLKVLTPLLLLILAATASPADSRADDVDVWIKRIGNTDDVQRVKLLKEFRAQPNLAEPLRGDVDKLLPLAEMWANGRDVSQRNMGRPGERPYLVFFHNRIDLVTPKLSEGSPLEPVVGIYRARMLIWSLIERGASLRDDAVRKPIHAEALSLLRAAHSAFPENEIVRMYLGERLPWKKEFAGADSAPKWAALERELLERLTDVIEWWIDNRQLDDGQYGGEWGDDCELWRGWAAVLLGFESPRISAAQATLSRGLLSLPDMQKGYTSVFTDVEHSAEDTSDTITPMMFLDPDNPEWAGRARKLAELMETRWTGRNERGFLQFKSTYFTPDTVDTRPRTACDTVFHPRVVQPALLLWQRTGDEELTRLFGDWIKTWVDASTRSDRGKPAGIIPSAIHWPDGQAGGLTPQWWLPGNYHTTLYDWPSALGMVLESTLLAWHMTGDEMYLQPLRDGARLRLKYLSNPPKSPPIPGSATWCAENREFADSLARIAAKYKLISGSGEFDSLLAAEAPPYLAFRFRGEMEPMLREMQRSVDTMRYNFPAYTSEVRYTDRLFTFHDRWLAYTTLPDATGPKTLSIFQMVTGEPGGSGVFLMNAVRWLTPPRDIAALVTESTQSRFAARLYHFGERPRDMSAELYLLAPGKYKYAIQPVDSPADSEPLSRGTFSVMDRRVRIQFSLPPRREVWIRIEKQ